VGGINVLPSLEYIEKEISHAKKMRFPTYVELANMPVRCNGKYNLLTRL
jgi:hypothetical protein